MENENDNIIEENKTGNNGIETDEGNKTEDSVIEADVDNKTEEINKNSPEEKLKEAQDKILRALAETENQRRRFEKETKEAFEYGGFNFARETLSVLDNLQRAYQSIKNNENFKASKDLNKFLENIEIIEKDLITIFEKNNIKKINCLNEKFDANNHQAMLEIEDESVNPGTILQEIQPGYFYRDRLLRPSYVAISKKKNNKSNEKEEKNKI